METELYTIHSRNDGLSGDVRIVGDGRHPLSVLPPLWAVWRGLWITLLLQAVVLGLVAVYAPVAFGTALLGFVVLTLLEGPSFERAELRLRGWREIAVAEARSEEGAEEAYRTGKAVMT